MGNLKHLGMIACFVFVATGCDGPGEDDIGTYLSDVSGSNNKLAENGGFVIPDSINTSLIIATWTEKSPKGHCILLYSDTAKKTANRIKYLADGGVVVDRLEKTSYNSFRSVSNDGEYSVEPSMVIYNYSISANATSAIDYERTDVKR